MLKKAASGPAFAPSIDRLPRQRDAAAVGRTRRHSPSRPPARSGIRGSLLAALYALIAIAGVGFEARAQAPAATAGSAAPPALRIPDGSRPVRYELTLTIVPGEAKVAGEIAIDVALDRPHRSSGSTPTT